MRARSEKTCPGPESGCPAGHDIQNRLDELVAEGHALKNMDTGEPLRAIQDRVPLSQDHWRVSRG